MMTAKNRVFKTRSEKRGGHWHVAVFSADGPQYTYAKMGDLVMDEDDFINFTTAFKAMHERQEDVF